MSLGYCGRIELFCEDESAVIYRYCGENWNDHSPTRGDIHVLDGEIIIKKRCLLQDSEDVLRRSIESGDIEIVKPCTSENSQGIYLGTRRMYFALRLLLKVFKRYHEDGMLPQSCSFIV